MLHRSYLIAIVAAAIALADPYARAQNAADPLADEITRLSRMLDAQTSSDDLWRDVKASAGPALTAAKDALAAGNRYFALERVAAARQSISAADYALRQPPEIRANLPGFEKEWQRLRGVLAPQLEEKRPVAAVQSIRPAIARALAEAALAQVKIYFDASLEYGRNTTPQFGLFYLGAAQAQRDFLEFARSFKGAAAPAPPPVRSVGSEIDALEGDLLAAYRPPASIDRHPEFIAASAALKEARELNSAGLRHAALLRYLQAAQRTAMLRGASSGGSTEIDAALKDAESRFEARVDHSIGRLFVERARIAGLTGDGAATSSAIVRDVLPRYFAALTAARPARPEPESRVTVTLVRWPFT